MYDNILYRDIIVRHNLSKEKTLKELVFYLASNIGKNITSSALRRLLKLGSTTTVSDYLEYLQDCYLCFLINPYYPSLKKQMLAEKKQYFIDHGMARLIGFRPSDDTGRLLENIVFIELLRRNGDIYVHRGKKECDFILRNGNLVTQAIQVCKQLEQPKTYQRKIEGLLEAMEVYGLREGLILTEELEREETLTQEDKSYKVLIKPIWKWLLED